MMGKQPQAEPKLFYYGLRLEDRVPQDHLLRKIRGVVDFDFTYDLVKDHYGTNGNVSVPPPVILKLMLVLFLYDVPSERELMRSLPYRLDWLWFLGYDLDSEIPDHSVLSKARSRWGSDVFETVFARGVSACVKAGLVDGHKIHMDGSLVDANASNNSVCKGSEVLIERLRQELRGQMAKLDEAESSSQEAEPVRQRAKKYTHPKNRSMVSVTDPDATIVRKGPLSPHARYKHHRVVDDRCGVITAVQTTSGDVEENSKLMPLVEQHQKNTSCKVETIVADAQYGTVENFRACQEQGLVSHMADFSSSQIGRPQQQGIFGIEQFTYDPEGDTYCCPAGQLLTRRKHKTQRLAYEYACAAAVCLACSMRSQCTRAKGRSARTIKRHYGQEAIDLARQQSHSPAAKRDRQRRKWLMEGSFGDAATHHGFKRARWRRLWRQRIQDWLIATVQNLRTLVRHARAPIREACADALSQAALVTDVIVTTVDLLADLLLSGDLTSCRSVSETLAERPMSLSRRRLAAPGGFGQQPVKT
jgi:transposase